MSSQRAGVVTSLTQCIANLTVRTRLLSFNVTIYLQQCNNNNIGLLLQDCKRWLQNHGIATAVEMSYYLDSIQSLVQSISFDVYLQEMLTRAMTWSQLFIK